MFLRKVEQTIKKHQMLNRGDKVLIAVSGGPDSVTLLDVLFSLRHKYDLTLSVAHLNHMLRGKEAERDLCFVKELSGKLGLAFFSGKRNVRSFAKETHVSLEEAGRKLRYDLLQDVAKREGMNKVALGQTADDQAETVLIAFVRGSGLAGLSGIPPVRILGRSGIKIIRPLVEIFRIEIEKYLGEKKISSRLDASNLEPVYFRNKIRLELLPLIAHEYNPNMKSVLVRLAGILREDNRYLIEKTAELVPEMLAGDNEKIKINLKALKSVPIALRQRLVREAVNQMSGNMRPLSVIHWERIRKLIGEGKTGAYVVVPDRVVVRKQYGNLLLMCEKGERERSDLDYELEVPGKDYVPEIGLTVDLCLLRKEEVSRLDNGPRVACFDCDRVKLPLHMRFRKAGDRFSPLGVRGSKKLKDFFIDMKVPAPERDGVPLLLGNGEIIWVMDPDEHGWGRIGEKVKVTEKTARVLQVKVVSSTGMCYNHEVAK